MKVSEINCGKEEKLMLLDHHLPCEKKASLVFSSYADLTHIILPKCGSTTRALPMTDF